MAGETACMANPDHDDSGKFTSKRDPEDYLNAIREHGGMASTSEITETVDVKYRTAHYNLTKLREQGRVSVRDVGGSYLWIVEDDE